MAYANDFKIVGVQGSRLLLVHSFRGLKEEQSIPILLCILLEQQTCESESLMLLILSSPENYKMTGGPPSSAVASAINTPGVLYADAISIVSFAKAIEVGSLPPTKTKNVSYRFRLQKQQILRVVVINKTSNIPATAPATDPYSLVESFSLKLEESEVVLLGGPTTFSHSPPTTSTGSVDTQLSKYIIKSEVFLSLVAIIRPLIITFEVL